MLIALLRIQVQARTRICLLYPNARFTQIQQFAHNRWDVPFLTIPAFCSLGALPTSKQQISNANGFLASAQAMEQDALTHNLANHTTPPHFVKVFYLMQTIFRQYLYLWSKIL